MRQGARPHRRSKARGHREQGLPFCSLYPAEPTLPQARPLCIFECSRGRISLRARTWPRISRRRFYRNKRRQKLNGRLRNRIFDAHKFQPVRLVGEAQSVLSHFSEHRIYEPRRELRTVIFASFTLSLTAALSGILSMNRS